jgi:hypothetical protein
MAGGGFTVAAILIFLFQRWEDATDWAMDSMDSVVPLLAGSFIVLGA